MLKDGAAPLALLDLVGTARRRSALKRLLEVIGTRDAVRLNSPAAIIDDIEALVPNYRGRISISMTDALGRLIVTIDAAGSRPPIRGSIGALLSVLVSGKSPEELSRESGLDDEAGAALRSYINRIGQADGVHIPAARTLAEIEDMRSILSVYCPSLNEIRAFFERSDIEIGPSDILVAQGRALRGHIKKFFDLGLEEAELVSFCAESGEFLAGSEIEAEAIVAHFSAAKERAFEREHRFVEASVPGWIDSEIKKEAACDRLNALGVKARYCPPLGSGDRFTPGSVLVRRIDLEKASDVFGAMKPSDLSGNRVAANPLGSVTGWFADAPEEPGWPIDAGEDDDVQADEASPSTDAVGSAAGDESSSGDPSGDDPDLPPPLPLEERKEGGRSVAQVVGQEAQDASLSKDVDAESEDVSALPMSLDEPSVSRPEKKRPLRERPSSGGERGSRRFDIY